MRETTERELPRLGAGAFEKRLQILHALRAGAGMSKVELSRRLRMSPTTSGALVADLMNAGLVVTDGFGLSTGGRPPERLVLNASRPLALAIDLGETDVHVGVFNLRGERIAAERVPFKRSGDQVRLGQVLLRARRLVERHRDVAGVGVAVPGIVDREAGIVRNAANIGWYDFDAVEECAAVLRLPVSIDRNTNAALLGEEWWGSGASADPIVLVTLGSGIGAAIKVNGRLVLGASASAGQFGHIPVDADGPVCGCGKRGCLEAMASSRALLRRYAQLRRDGTPRRTTVRAVSDAARSGDPASIQALMEIAQRLGMGLVTLVNLINPRQIILGGELMDAEDIILPTVRQAIAERALGISAEVARISVSSFREEAALVGAAALAFESLFHRLAHIPLPSRPSSARDGLD